MVTRLISGVFAVGMAFPALSHAAWQFFDPTDTAAVPKLFSQTGFYTNWAAKTVTPEAHYYEVNSALWSDGAHKSRWIILPTGTKVTFDENNDFWDYPDGATFVKLFKHDLVPGDSTTSIWWETRVLIKKSGADPGNDWFGFSYRWNTDGSEAHLVSGDGTPDSVVNVGLTFWPKGKTNPSSIKKWHFPNSFECQRCHVPYENQDWDQDPPVGIHGRSVLGFFTPQINRPSKANPSINQITEFFGAGILQWANKAGQTPTPAEIAAMPKWYSITDNTADLNMRARSYLAANCSGCHGDRGIINQATTGRPANYDFHTNKPHMSLSGYDMQISYGIEGEALLVPGDTAKSIILYRQKHRLTYQADLAAWNMDTSPEKPPKAPLIFQDEGGPPMPPLATYEEDTAATKVLAQWILAFDTTSDIVGIRSSLHAKSLRAPTLDGRHLRVPGEMAGKVSLFGINGREYRLQALGGSLYALPPSLQRGLYIVRVGAQSFRQYLY